MCPPRSLLLLVVAFVAAAMPCGAHHRQTPPVVMLTSSGDTPLSRQAVVGRGTLVLEVDDGGLGKKIVTLSPFRPNSPPDLQTVIAATGDHSLPAISQSGRSIVFQSESDPAGSGRSGEQIVAATKRVLSAPAPDPSGTSENPAIDNAGRRIVFESMGDLAGLGSAGTRQVYLRAQDGTVTQLSRGLGSSRNPVVTSRRNLVAFESTSHPASGVDTGIAQLWVGDALTGVVDAVTAGLGPSTNPAVCADGRLVAFESTADLADTQANTPVSRIFVYDSMTQTFARITDGPASCHLPTLHKDQNDWRIAYVCDGVPQFAKLRAATHFQIQTPGGSTQRIFAGMGLHFMVLSTTADLSDESGTTPGNQVYVVNLHKRPPVPIPGSILWFPFQGISPL